MTATLKMISDASLRPNYLSFYHLPLAAYIYLPFFIVMLVFLRLSGLFTSLAELKEFGQLYFANFLPLARFITVLVGLAAIYLLYKICQKLFKNNFIACLAAFFLSTSLLFVQSSHFARVWVPQILAVLLAFYFIIILYQAPKAKLKNYLLAALGVGLAFGTHLVGVFIYASFLAAHYIKNQGRGFKKIFITNNYFWLANILFVILYLIIYWLNTYGFIHYLGGIIPDMGKILKVFSSSPIDSSDLAVETSGQVGFIKIIVYYITTLINNEPLLSVLSLLGLVILFMKNKRIFSIIVSFILVYMFFICFSGMRIARYILPVIPFLAITAAYGFYFIYINLNKKIKPLILALLCILLLIPPLLWDWQFIKPSTRAEAVKWIYKNIPAGAGIINLDANLELNENRQSIKDIEKYSTFLTKKRAYLLSSKDSEFPKPDYYIYFYYHYEQIPAEISVKKFNYLVLHWYNKEELEQRLNLIKPFKNLQKPILVKRIPETAGPDSLGYDLTSNMKNPLSWLLKMKINGPIVDVYKLQ